MAARIDAHVARRPASWTTVEAGDVARRRVADAAGAACCSTASALDRRRPAPSGGVRRSPDAVLAAVGERVRAEVDARSSRPRAAGAAIVVAEQAGAGVLPARRRRRAPGWTCSARRPSASRPRARRAPTCRRRPRHPARPPRRRPSPRSDGGRRSPRCAATATATSAPATPTTPSTSSPAGRRRGCATALEAALDDGRAALPRRRDRAPRRSPRCHGRDAGGDRRRPTAPPRRCGCCRPRCARALAACVHPGFTEAEAALRAHGVPVARVLRDPAAGFALDPAARARGGRPRHRRQPRLAERHARSRPRRSSRCAGPAASSSSTRRSWTSSPARPARSSASASTTSSSCAALTKALAIPGLRAGYAVAAAAARRRGCAPCARRGRPTRSRSPR